MKKIKGHFWYSVPSNPQTCAPRSSCKSCAGPRREMWGLGRNLCRDSTCKTSHSTCKTSNSTCKTSNNKFKTSHSGCKNSLRSPRKFKKAYGRLCESYPNSPTWHQSLEKKAGCCCCRLCVRNTLLLAWFLKNHEKKLWFWVWFVGSPIVCKISNL